MNGAHEIQEPRQILEQRLLEKQKMNWAGRKLITSEGVPRGVGTKLMDCNLGTMERRMKGGMNELALTTEWGILKETKRILTVMSTLID